MEKNTLSENKTELFTTPIADVWFDDFIGEIRKDQVMLQTGLASQKQKNLYTNLIEGNVKGMIKQTNQYFISKIIIDYLKILGSSCVKPIKIAFDYASSRVLVWAEVNDEQVEDKLILAQAEINYQYNDCGIYLSTTIVYSEDKLTIPSHYKELTD